MLMALLVTHHDLKPAVFLGRRFLSTLCSCSEDLAVLQPMFNTTDVFGQGTGLLGFPLLFLLSYSVLLRLMFLWVQRSVL